MRKSSIILIALIAAPFLGIAAGRYVDRQEAINQARLPTSDKKEEPVMKPDRPRPLPPKPEDETKPASHVPLQWADCIERKAPEELCEFTVPTFTYIWNVDGTLTFLCKSLGFGVPGKDGGKYTWVACIDHESKKVGLAYIEPNVLVSEHMLANEGGSLQSQPHHGESQL